MGTADRGGTVANSEDPFAVILAKAFGIVPPFLFFERECPSTVKKIAVDIFTHGEEMPA